MTDETLRIDECGDQIQEDLMCLLGCFIHPDEMTLVCQVIVDNFAKLKERKQ